MMNKINFLILSILICSNIYGFDYRLSKASQDTAKIYDGLASNGVTCIAFQGDSTIWYGTGAGLSASHDLGNNFIGYFTGEKTLPYGSITAVEVLDSIVWCAGVYDTTIRSIDYSIGGGLSISKDFGVSWDYIQQPVYDTADTLEIWAGDTVRFLANTTRVNNTTWDMAITKDYVYITSWAGGLQRSNDYGKNWQRVPLPADSKYTLGNEHIDYMINPNDPINGGNHNHKGFSVIAYSDTIWVGTANGINRGIIKNDYIEWTKFNAQNSSISGNFVVALHRQLHNGIETIWAVTLPTENQGEYQAISKSNDAGLTWTTVLENERGYSINNFGATVFVGTDNGLYRSDNGENWVLYRNAKETGGDHILDDVVYEAKIDTRTETPFLWIGTSDGIAKTDYNKTDWEVYRSVQSTSKPGQPLFYAYPNPFSPTHQNQLNGVGHVRFQYDLDKPGKVILEIFNFAMERIYKNTIFEDSVGDNALTWNGRNDDGFYVANGTYFCKLTKKSRSNTSSGWTKLIIVK